MPSEINHDDIQWDDADVAPPHGATASALNEGGIQWDDAPKESPKPPVSWGDWLRKGAAGFATGVGEVVPFGQDIPAAIGTVLSEAGVGPKYVPTEGSFGERFETAKRAQQRAAEVAGEQAPAAQLAGNVTGLVGSVAPMAAVSAPVEAAIAARATPLVGELGSQIASGAVTGAGFGAAQGAGEGTSLQQRLENAASGAKTGAIFGAGAPAVVSALTKPYRAINPLAHSAPLSEAEEAAQRLGVELPAYIGTESRVPKQLAMAANAMPLGGGKIAESAKKAASQIEEKAENVLGGALPAFEAGSAAKSGIQDWMTERSKRVVNRAYDAVERHIDKGVESELLNTSRLAQEILDSRAAAGLGDSSAVKFVQEAITRPEGLTFSGIKNLRTALGEMLDSPSLLPAETSQTELKRLYGTLSDDLAAAAEKAGGPRGVAAFERANKLNNQVQAKRKELAKIVGEKGSASAEQVYARISAMAQSGGRGDLQKLTTARKSMSPEQWEDVTSGIIGDLGRSAEGFSPVRFHTAYGKIPESAKDVLFGPEGHPTRQAMNDLYTVANKFKELGKFSNPSGTAQVVAGIALLAHPMHLIHGPLMARAVSRILSNPRTSPSAVGVLKGHLNDVMRGLDPASAKSATQAALRNYMVKLNMESEDTGTKREERADGGKVGKRDYPARRLTRLEKAAKKARDELALESKPIMSMADEQVADALRIAERK